MKRKGSQSHLACWNDVAYWISIKQRVGSNESKQRTQGRCMRAAGPRSLSLWCGLHVSWPAAAQPAFLAMCIWGKQGGSEGSPGGSDSRESACNAGDPGSIPGSGRSPGEGHSNPLQYSCLESPMDRGARWATVHGVTKSRTRLSDSHRHTHTHIRVQADGRCLEPARISSLGKMQWQVYWAQLQLPANLMSTLCICAFSRQRIGGPTWGDNGHHQCVDNLGMT